jgi:thioredoxin 1
MADITITDANFESEVMKSDKPVLVDFWAVWCGPCQVQGPIVEDVAQSMVGKAKVGKMNVDENPHVPQTFGIMSIPTLMIFKGGTVVKQFVGVQSKETLLSELNKLIN